jgi:hypothetical protein
VLFEEVDDFGFAAGGDQAGGFLGVLLGARLR